MKTCADIMPPFGIALRTVDVRIQARANFAKGEVVELDTRMAQSLNLLFGSEQGGWCRAIKPTEDGSKHGFHAVTLSAISFGQFGRARFQGRVSLYTGSTQAVGSIIVVGSLTDGHRVKGRILTTGANGYNDIWFHGGTGFGEYVVEETLNEPPEANIVATPTTGYAPLTVFLDASGSTDVDGTIVNYKFNDGEGGGYIDNGISDHKSVVYETPGVYYPSVLVTDNDDGQDAHTTMVIVLDPGNGGSDHDQPRQPIGGSDDISVVPI